MSKSYHHGALAEAMVDLALAEVRKHGAAQVSLRAIAHALEVSPSAAYNHFADKDALLHAVALCGLAALDERMTRVLAAHTGSTPEASLARFAGLGRAYILFAVEDPHLFRLTFSPVCGAHDQASTRGGPYLKLNQALDELDAKNLLRPGIRPGLDLTVWSATHGTACLIVEGLLPPEAADEFIEDIGRLIRNHG